MRLGSKYRWSTCCEKVTIKYNLSNQEKIKECISILKGAVVVIATGLTVHSRIRLKVSVVDGFNQLFSHLYDVLLSSWNTQRRLASESDTLAAWEPILLFNIPIHFKTYLNLCNPQNANLCLESTRQNL